MSALNYGRRPHDDEDYEPEAPQLLADESLQEDTSGTAALEDAGDDRRQATGDLATIFPDRELPDSKNELHDRLEGAWQSFEDAGAAGRPESGRDFKLATAYSLTDTALTDPAGEGPLAYQADGPASYRDRDNPTRDHTSASHQHFLHHALDGTASWQPGEPEASAEALNHLPRLKEMLETNERHIADFTAVSLTNPPTELENLSWTRSMAENTEALNDLTDGFTNSENLDSLLTFQLDTLQETRDTLSGIPGPGRTDETGMLKETAESAISEYRDGRNRLVGALAGIRDAVPGQDTIYLQEEAAEILAHMDFCHALADHAALQAQFELEDLLQTAQAHATAQGRLAGVIIAQRGA